MERPAKSELLVETDAGTNVGITTQPIVSAAQLSVRGFVFEHHRLRTESLTPGKLLHPLLIFPLAAGVDFEWKSGDRWQRGTSTPGLFIALPARSPIEGRWQGELDALFFSFDLMECRLRIEDLTIPVDINLAPHFNVEDEQIWHLALALKAEAERGCPAGRVYLEALALAMSSSLLSRYRLGGSNAASDLAVARLHTVLRYIRENISDDLQLEILADVARTTRDNFRRLFKQVTGTTPHHYILQQRIDKAKQLLGDPKVSIAEIAHAVGFSNQAHLATVFRRHERKSPNAYRKELPS